MLAKLHRRFGYFGPRMQFVSDVWAGLKANRSAYGMLRQAHLLRSFLFSLGLTVLFVWVSAWGIQWLVDAADAAYNRWWPAEEEAGNWGDLRFWKSLLQQGGWWLLRTVLWVGLWWLKMKLMKYMVLIFIGPLMAWVSEKMEHHLTGQARSWDAQQWLREGLRGLRSAAWMFIWEISLTVSLFFMGLLLTWLAGPLSLFFSPILAVLGVALGAWFYGASVLDYVWERRGMGARNSLRQTARHHGLALGLGLPFLAWMSLPWVGWILAPIFAPVLCAAAASLAWWNLNAQTAISELD